MLGVLVHRLLRTTSRNAAMPPRHSRIGLALFFVYLLFYGGFVLLAAFSPGTLEATPLAGVNLAIWYGFALIAVAIVMAFVYGWASRDGAARRGRDDPARTGGGEA